MIQSKCEFHLDLLDSQENKEIVLQIEFLE